MFSSYFTPHTLFWRVNSDLTVNLGLARALLLEIAHPLVAAGVADHSNYRGDRYGRLIRSLFTVNDILFADGKELQHALRHFNACHARVKGELKESVGPLSGGAAYSANDPLLKLWVMASGIDSYLLAYEQFVAPLSLAAKQEYYRDCLRLGQLFGIPRSLIPATYEDFNAYVQAMFNSAVLTVGPAAREIVRELFMPPLARTLCFFSIGLLPERIRSEFGFEWDEKKEKWLRRLAAVSRRVRPFLPHLLATHPRALIAEWRYRLRSTTA